VIAWLPMKSDVRAASNPHRERLNICLAEKRLTLIWPDQWRE
ncbi:MAG: hypothetical protein QG619_1423, partial [Pseudomonadota bacterium]|nr:hypothetical protein [Pseudomonadota bacterium]